MFGLCCSWGVLGRFRLRADVTTSRMPQLFIWFWFWHLEKAQEEGDAQHAQGRGHAGGAGTDGRLRSTPWRVKVGA